MSLDALNTIDLSNVTPEQLLDLLGDDVHLYAREAAKAAAAIKAKDSILGFMQFMMPDPNDEDNTAKSRYEIHAVHKLLAESLESVIAGKCLRLAISVPPQIGKSQLSTRGLPAWAMGKNPWRNIIVGTYNQTFAGDFGEDVRALMLHERFARVFPDCTLRTGSKSKEQLVTDRGGKISFIGRDGSGTGKSADLFIIDDPYKNKQDADSLAARDEVWGFFTRVVNTRMLNTGAVIIIHTRWHEDDLIGRLTDHTNPHYNEEVAKHWTYINIPEIMDDEKVAGILGKKLGDALWPERRNLDMLNQARLMDPVGFSALHMGRPTPPEGSFYKAEHFRGYERGSQPKEMRYYLTGDLATSTKNSADKTAIGVWGIDSEPHPNLWLMPQVFWKRSSTDASIDELISLAKMYGIFTAYFEKGQLDNAIGPFLERAMREAKPPVHFALEKFPTNGDKGARSLSFRALCAHGRVRFPTFAPWWPAAKEQMLKFTGSGNDREDDFADMCGLIGVASNNLMRASAPQEEKILYPKVGTLAWTKWASNVERERDSRMRRMWVGNG